MLITRFDRHENNGYGKSRCTSLRRTTCSSDSLGLEFLKSKKCIGLAEKNADLAAVTRSLEFTIPYPVWLISLILFSPFCFFFFFSRETEYGFNQIYFFEDHFSFKVPGVRFSDFNLNKSKFESKFEKEYVAFQNCYRKHEVIVKDWKGGILISSIKIHCTFSFPYLK